MAFSLGCGGSSSSSGGGNGGGDQNENFVFDYQPKLTEAEGTEYPGNFFPIGEGYTWRWDGYGSITGKIKVSGSGESSAEDLYTPNQPIYATTKVLPPENIILGGTDYFLYPLKESAVMDSSITAIESIIRYYEMTDDAVYIRGIQAENGTIIKIEDPIFIKIPLVAGDSWETQPHPDFDEILSSTDELDFSFCGAGTPSHAINATSMVYVVGKEMKNGYDTVRIDHRAQAIGTITIPNVGTLDINVEITEILNLGENYGIIASSQMVDYDFSGTLKCQGEKIKLSSEMALDIDLELTSHYAGSSESTGGIVSQPSNIQKHMHEVNTEGSISEPSDKETAQKIEAVIMKIAKSLIIN